MPMPCRCNCPAHLARHIARAVDDEAPHLTRLIPPLVGRVGTQDQQGGERKGGEAEGGGGALGQLRKHLGHDARLGSGVVSAHADCHGSHIGQRAGHPLEDAGVGQVAQVAPVAAGAAVALPRVKIEDRAQVFAISLLPLIGHPIKGALRGAVGARHPGRGSRLHPHSARAAALRPTGAAEAAAQAGRRGAPHGGAAQRVAAGQGAGGALQAPAGSSRAAGGALLRHQAGGHGWRGRGSCRVGFEGAAGRVVEPAQAASPPK
jgi:hypothetical protein